MKTFTAIVLAGLFFLILGVHTSDAQMCGCMGKMGEEGHMPMMGEDGHMPMMMGGGMHEGMMHADHPLWRDLAHLGLTERQKEAVREIKHGAIKVAIKKGADMKIAQLELKDLLEKEPVDMKAVEAKLKEIEALRTDIHLSFIKATEEIRSQLTPAQKKKLEEKKTKMCGHMMEQEDMKHHHADMEMEDTESSEGEEAPAMEHQHY
jgi:Spy/CpxP family protein refolding chaperone